MAQRKKSKQSLNTTQKSVLSAIREQTSLEQMDSNTNQFLSIDSPTNEPLKSEWAIVGGCVDPEIQKL